MLQILKKIAFLPAILTLGLAQLSGCGPASASASRSASQSPAASAPAPSEINCKGVEFAMRYKLTTSRCGAEGVTEEVWSYETTIVNSTELVDLGAATFFCSEAKTKATLLSAFTDSHLRLDARRDGTYELSRVGFYIDTLRCNDRF